MDDVENHILCDYDDDDDDLDILCDDDDYLDIYDMMIIWTYMM